MPTTQRVRARDLSAANIGDRIDVDARLRPSLRAPEGTQVSAHGTVKRVTPLGQSVKVTLEDGTVVVLPVWMHANVTRAEGRAPMPVSPEKPRRRGGAHDLADGTVVQRTVGELDRSFIGHHLSLTLDDGAVYEGELRLYNRDRPFEDSSELVLDGTRIVAPNDKQVQVTIVAVDSLAQPGRRAEPLPAA